MCRAERPFKANPTNLIRVMPAEGERCTPASTSHSDRGAGSRPSGARAPARARSARALHHQRGGAEFHRQCAACGRLRSVDDAVGRGDRPLRRPGADALLVNLGTFDGERRQATEIAVETAAQDNVPWVLDPVFVDRAPPRADFARELVARGRRSCGSTVPNSQRWPAATPSREAFAAMRVPTRSSSGCRARPISSLTARALARSPTAIR